MRYSDARRTPYTPVPNSILEDLCKVNLSPYEWRVLLFILRKTHGYHKESDRIPLSQFSNGTELDRRHVHRALKGLRSKRIVVTKGEHSEGLKYAIQPDSAKWRLSPLEMTEEARDGQGVTSTDDKPSPVQMTKLSSPAAPSKEKEIKFKEIKTSKKEWEILKSSLNRKLSSNTEMTEADIEKRKALLREQARQLEQGA